MSLGFAVFSELAIRSGELQAQAPAGVDKLLFIDRWVAERDEIEEGSSLLSTLSVGVTGAYALVDSILSSASRDNGEDGLTQAVLYGEVVLLNWAAGNMTKLAVRRPRPRAYYEVRTAGVSPEETDSALSFYSLHSAMAAGLSATASYFAWKRNPASVEAWLTITAGTLITAYTGYERVRALAHFPTDVLAGILFGAGIGVLVPELHRNRGPLRLLPTTDGQSTVGLGGLYIF
jgi:undecaprenyl-diphosphatase